jgi:pyruvate kinase
MLEKGQTFRLDLDEALGDNSRVMLPHPEIIVASEIDHVLLIDDGKVKLTVVGKGEQYLECRVDVPGKISNRKVNRTLYFQFVFVIFHWRFIETSILA